VEQAHEHADVLDLRDYLAVLRRRWRTIAGVVAVTVAVALAVSVTRAPVYRASAEVVVVPVRSGDALEQVLLRQAGMGTQARIASSIAIAERAVATLGLEIAPSDLVERVSVDPIRDTNVLEIAVTWGDAQTAAAVAQTLSEEFLETRREAVVQGQAQARALLDDEIERVRDRIGQLDGQIASAEARGEEDSGSTTALRQERDTLLAQLGQLTAQGTSLGLTDISEGGEIIRPAQVPGGPVSPKPMRTGVLALVLGAMLGVGLAFLKDFLDDAVHDDDDVRRAAHGRPVLGHLPSYGGAVGGGRPPLPTLNAPSHPAAEAARTLRTNLRFVAAETQLRSVAITSAGEGEGKTTVAANLAAAASRAGTKVLLIDADLRRPTVHKVFGLDNVGGTSELIVGGLEIRDAIREVGVPNLRVITGGMRPPNPAELLGSSGFRGLLGALEELCDLVIIDTPPVLPVADTLEVGHVSGGVVIVVTAGATSKRSVREAVSRLDEVGARVLGTAVNRIDQSQSYYYAYAYGDEVDQESSDEWHRRFSAGGNGDGRIGASPESGTPAASPPHTGASTPTDRS